MSLFPHAIIEQVLQALDGEAVLRTIDYRPETIQEGGDRIKCFCPIHHETIFRTLVIEKREKTYRCTNFSCDGHAGGDLIDLFARARGLSYEQALLSLAEAFGLAIDNSVIEGYLETTLEVARNYLDLGALAEAEEQLTGLLSIQPECLAALEAMAQVYARQRRREPLQETRLQLARVLTAAGNYERALESIEACRAVDPEDTGIARQAIATLSQAGRAQQAAAETLALADRLARQGEINRALEAYRGAQALAVDGLDVWGPMIELLLQAGRREEAVAECVRQAEFEGRAGNSEEAFQALERALGLDPASESLYLRQAQLVAEARLTGRQLEGVCQRLETLLEARSHGTVDRALGLLETVFGDDARVVCLRADLEEGRGDAERALDLRLGVVDSLENAHEFERALDVLERTLGGHAGNVALLSRKANLLRAIGKSEAAVAIYLDIVEMFRGIEELENAAAIYQTVIALQPDEMEHRRRQLDLYLRLGPEPVIVEKTLDLVELCVTRGETPEAIRLLERALEAAPESSELLGRCGALYEQCGRRGEAAERLLAAGRLLAARGEIDEAQQAMERALRCVPEHLETREHLAGVLLTRGETLQAIGIYGDLAGFYLRERETEAAVRLCEQILAAQPDHEPTLQLLAQAHEAAGDEERHLGTSMRIVDLHLRAQDWGKAGALCEAILARHEDYPPAIERLVAVAEATRQDENSNQHLWHLAQAHRRAGRPAEELAVLERLLKADPLHLGAWQRQMDLQAQRAAPRALAAAVGLLCGHFERAGRIDDAIAILEGLNQSVESPKPELCAGLARLYEARGDQSGQCRALRLEAELLGRLMRDAEALDAWDALARLEPDDHNILRMRIELMKRNDMTQDLSGEYLRLARALTKVGHEDQAQVALLEVIGLRPRDVTAREDLIDLMIRRNDRVGARHQIEETAARQLEENDPRRAIALYERILTFDPDDQPTFQRIIAVYQRIDDLPGAMAVYERLLDVLAKRPEGFEFEQAAIEALQMDPTNDRARRRLADFYVREGRPTEAETLLLTLAVGQLEADDLDGAEQTLGRLLAINPQSVPGRAHHAELMVRRGHTDAALSEFMSLTGQLALHEGLQSLIQPGEAMGRGGGPGRGMPASHYEGISLIKDYTFDNFVIGERNNFAHAAAVAVCRAPGKNYNPLFLFSDVGLGKTHLCHAIAHYVRDHHPEMKVRYITMEEFVSGLIDAIGGNTITTFRSWHKLIDVLIMDDVQFLSGKERAQEEFFHVFNTLYQAGKQVVLTSDRPPKDISHLEKRLKSRFGAGIIVDIQSPDLETRVAILRHELAARGCKGTLSNEVLLFIAEHVETNVRELKGALNQVLVRHEVSGLAIDLVATRKILDQSLAGA